MFFVAELLLETTATLSPLITSLRILPIVSKLYHGHNLRAKSFNNFAKYLITTTHLHLAHSACGIQCRYE